jgi:hypothetical protein
MPARRSAELPHISDIGIELDIFALKIVDAFYWRSPECHKAPPSALQETHGIARDSRTRPPQVFPQFIYI